MFHWWLTIVYSLVSLQRTIFILTALSVVCHDRYKPAKMLEATKQSLDYKIWKRSKGVNIYASLYLIIIHCQSHKECLFWVTVLFSDAVFCQQPSCAVTTKKFTYFLVKTGTLMLKAHSDLRGYTPGQIIKLSTEIHNKSGKDTGYILASLIQVDIVLSWGCCIEDGLYISVQLLVLSDWLCLIQKVTYKMKRPLFDLRTIAEVEGAGVKAGKHAEWKEQIIVPPLPQSALAGCSLIDVEYFVQVSSTLPHTSL